MPSVNQKQPVVHNGQQQRKGSSVQPANSKELERSQSQLDDAQGIERVKAMIDKKIRNLEKRRKKLIELKQSQQKGEAIREEQRDAIKKLADVEQNIEFADELNKQVNEMLVDYQKQMKQQAARERRERVSQDQELIRQVLTLYHTLHLLVQPAVKPQLLGALNGYPQLSASELDACERVLVSLCPSVQTAPSVADWHKGMGEAARTAQQLLQQPKDVRPLPASTSNEVNAALKRVDESDLFERVVNGGQAGEEVTTAVEVDDDFQEKQHHETNGHGHSGKSDGVSTLSGCEEEEQPVAKSASPAVVFDNAPSITPQSDKIDFLQEDSTIEQQHQAVAHQPQQVHHSAELGSAADMHTAQQQQLPQPINFYARAPFASNATYPPIVPSLPAVVRGPPSPIPLPGEEHARSLPSKFGGNGVPAVSYDLAAQQHQQLAEDPALASVEPAMPPQQRDLSNVACHVCGELGHLQRNCPQHQQQQQQQPTRGRETRECHNCGDVGHLAKNCPIGQASKDCHNCGKRGHIARFCADPRPNRNNQTCHNCGQPGHMARNCTADNNTQGAAQPQQQTRGTGSGAKRTCHRCHKPGHLARDCMNGMVNEQ